MGDLISIIVGILLGQLIAHKIILPYLNRRKK